MRFLSANTLVPAVIAALLAWLIYICIEQAGPDQLGGWICFFVGLLGEIPLAIFQPSNRMLKFIMAFVPNWIAYFLIFRIIFIRLSRSFRETFFN